MFRTHNQERWGRRSPRRCLVHPYRRHRDRRTHPCDYDSPHESVYVAASTVAFLAVVVAVIGVRALAARTGRPARLATIATWLVGVGWPATASPNETRH